MSDAAADPATATGHPPHAWLPDVHFGTAITPLPDVAAGPEDEDDEDDEDEEDVPADVTWMLGFDPGDEEDLGDDADDER